MNAKILKMVFVVLCCVFAVNVMEAQTFVSKKLKTEPDGFQWYEHKFKTSADFEYAAFSINGKRLTPNAIKVHYYTFSNSKFQLPQVFCCWEKKIYIGNDKNNQPQYCEVMSIYDIDGNCIIPSEKEYNSITYDPNELSLIFCNKYQYTSLGMESYDKTTYSKDGTYWAEGYIYNRTEFDAKKKLVPGALDYVTMPTPTPNPTPTPTPTPTPDPPRQPQPFQVWQECFMCGGSGQCRYCYGYGWAANGKDACGVCHGTGKCSQCAGHGGKNVIEYR